MTAEAFKDIFLPLHPAFYRVAFRLLNSTTDAEDMVQDLYVRLWNSRNSLSEIHNFEAYGVTMIRNKCLDRLRSAVHKADAQVASKETWEDIPQEDSLLDVKEDLQQVQRLMQQLPENQRLLFKLRYFNDCSLPEIEQITGMSASNVRVLLHRARTTVTQQFKTTHHV